MTSVARPSRTTASGPLRSTAELGRQARNFAQLLGHFFKSLRGLLRGQFRFRNPAREDRIALTLGVEQLLNFLDLGTALIGVGQPAGELFDALLFSRELLRQLLRAIHRLLHSRHLLHELGRRLPLGVQGRLKLLYPAD